MRGRLFRVVVFLLLGTTANVGVAWLGSLAWTRTALSSSYASSRGGLFTPSNEWLEFGRVDSPLYTQLYWSAGLHEPALDRKREARTGLRSPPSWSMVPSLPGYQQPDVVGHRKFMVIREIGSGFPMVSMVWYGRDVGGNPTPSTPVIRLPDHRVTPPRWLGSKMQVLPLRPAWPGFAVDSMFYAMLLWLVSASPNWVRRRVRAKRGLCPACAYPIGASAVCTECGKPVKLKPAEAAA